MSAVPGQGSGRGQGTDADTVGAIALSLACRVTSFGVHPFMIIWLQGMPGHSPLETGLRLLAMTVPSVIIAPFNGRLQKARHMRTPERTEPHLAPRPDGRS